MDITILIFSILGTIAGVVSAYFAWDAKKVGQEKLDIITTTSTSTFRDTGQWLVIDVTITNKSKTKTATVTEFYIDKLYGRNRVTPTLGKDVLYVPTVQPTPIVPTDSAKFTLYFSLPDRRKDAVVIHLYTLTENQRFCNILSFVPQWNE